MNINAIIDQVFPLPTNSKEILKSYFKEVRFPKRHIILESDRIEKSLFFISKGIVRAFKQTEESDITFWFGKEGDVVLSMRSYIFNQKAYEDIESLEECVLYEISIQQLKALFEKDIHIANWGRVLAEKELITTEERLINRQIKSAQERYQQLINNTPDLVQRVQLGHIASYLGITQVSLSRIRAKM